MRATTPAARRRSFFVPGDLPPLYVQIPEDQYIVDLGGASPQQIHDVLLAPPVEAVQRPYTVAEVTQNERLRDIVPRIDLDTITFDFGSSTITSSQMDELVALGQALEQVIAENPNEVYLIEGHTDAVGSQSDNLILSDQRAEAVAVGAHLQLRYSAGEPHHRGLRRAISEGGYGGAGAAEPARRGAPHHAAAAGAEPVASIAGRTLKPGPSARVSLFWDPLPGLLRLAASPRGFRHAADHRPHSPYRRAAAA